jgi:hypothetical protein
MRIGAYSAFGVGALGIGLGTVFMLKSSSKRSEADDLCNLPGGACPAEKRTEIDAADSDANSARTLGVVGLVIGGAGIVTGVALLVLDKGSATTAGMPKVAPSTATGVRIRPWVGLGSAGVAGRF